jgi:hypothetical protein
MKWFICLIGLSILPLASLAQSQTAAAAETVVAPEPPAPMDAAEFNLADFLWTKRPVVVFADSANDPAYALQMRYLAEGAAELDARDVIVITDTDPGTLSDIRRKLRPRGFMLVIMDKDGEVKLRKPLPWDVREITRSIDKFPLRLEELRQRRELGQ